MRLNFGFIGIALAAALAAAPAQAALLISVDKSTQLMTVAVDGETLHTWPVSTGLGGYDTPGGEFKPFRMEKDHFSREWDDAPMPNSIFFTMEGHAIHGTGDVKNLGKPASHGCVRLSKANSETLWTLVKQQKMANTRVVLTGVAPVPQGAPVAKRLPKAVPARDTDYERYVGTDGFYNDEYTSRSVPVRRERVVRGWREYNDGPRYFYYRENPPPRYGQRGLFGW